MRYRLALVTRLDGIVRGLANPETRCREAKPKEQE